MLLDCDNLLIDSNLIVAQNLNIVNDNYQWIFTNSSEDIIINETGISTPEWTIVEDNDSVIVQLIASNNYGCKNDTAQVTIRTIENPVADFIVSKDSACHASNDAIIQTDTTSLSTDGQYTWIVTNIGTNQQYYNDTYENVTLPSFELTNNSNLADSVYVIQLIVGNGDSCTAQSTDTIVIHPLPLADFVIQNQSCYDQELTINNQSIFADTVSYNWSASPNLYISDLNQSSPLINFPLNVSGSSVFYNLTLEIEDEYTCNNISTETIEVFTNPIADFSIPSAACGDTTLTVENISDFEQTYLWSIPNNNPIYTATISDENTENPIFYFPENTTDQNIIYTIELTSTT